MTRFITWLLLVKRNCQKKPIQTLVNLVKNMLFENSIIHDSACTGSTIFIWEVISLSISPKNTETFGTFYVLAAFELSSFICIVKNNFQMSFWCCSVVSLTIKKVSWDKRKMVFLLSILSANHKGREGMDAWNQWGSRISSHESEKAAKEIAKSLQK